MSSNTLKKMIIFSSTHVKSLIENMVSDAATEENRSASAIIEAQLLEGLLPKNEQARYVVEYQLYGDAGKENNIGATLSDIFSFNAAGHRGPWSCKYDNLLPLVEFACSESAHCNTRLTGKEPLLYHFRSQLDSICSNLEALAEDEKLCESQRTYYGKCGKSARDILKTAETDPKSLNFTELYRLVLDCWNVLNGWSITFRMLTDMADLEKKWRNTPETRRRLLRILNTVSKEWK